MKSPGISFLPKTIAKTLCGKVLRLKTAEWVMQSAELVQANTVLR